MYALFYLHYANMNIIKGEYLVGFSGEIRPDWAADVTERGIHEIGLETDGIVLAGMVQELGGLCVQFKKDASLGDQVIPVDAVHHVVSLALEGEPIVRTSLDKIVQAADISLGRTHPVSQQLTNRLADLDAGQTEEWHFPEGGVRTLGKKERRPRERY